MSASGNWLLINSIKSAVKIAKFIAKKVAIAASLIIGKVKNMPLFSSLLTKALTTGANSKIDKKTEQMIITQTKNPSELRKKISSAIKSSNGGNSWNVNVTISDKYDFELLKEGYADEFLLTVVNNGAYIYQQLGLLVPYEWDVSYHFIYEE